LKETLIAYKPFLFFLARFFAVYILATILYQYYLAQYDVAKNQVDGITKIVSTQTVQFMNFVDGNAYAIPNTTEPCMNVFYNNKWVVRIIEGCNAVSVLILFISFIIAFRGKIINTFAFICLGSVLIYIVNIIRIACLSISIYYYPAYQDFLHGIVFPLIIYGLVFVLWFVWIHKFSYYAK